MSVTAAPQRAAHLRIADQFAPAYLTLASIIQGVALTSLVTRVEPNAGGYSPSDWIRATTSLVVVLAIWHEYLVMVLAYVWLPTLLDSTVPFAFLVAELFMVHFLPADQPRWLVVEVWTINCEKLWDYAAGGGVRRATW